MFQEVPSVYITDPGWTRRQSLLDFLAKSHQQFLGEKRMGTHILTLYFRTSAFDLVGGPHSSLPRGGFKHSQESFTGILEAQGLTPVPLHIVTHRQLNDGSYWSQESGPRV